MNCCTLSIGDTTRRTVATAQSPQLRENSASGSSVRPTLKQRFSDLVPHKKTLVIAACTAIALLALGGVAVALKCAEDEAAAKAAYEAWRERMLEQNEPLCTHIAKWKGLDLDKITVGGGGLSVGNELNCFITAHSKERSVYNALCDTDSCRQSDFHFQNFLNGDMYNGGMRVEDNEGNLLKHLTSFKDLSPEDLKKITGAIQWKFRYAANQSL